MGEAHGQGENRNVDQFQKHSDGIQEFSEEHTRRTEEIVGSGKERRRIGESRTQRLWSLLWRFKPHLDVILCSSRRLD